MMLSFMSGISTSCTASNTRRDTGTNNASSSNDSGSCSSARNGSAISKKTSTSITEFAVDLTAQIIIGVGLIWTINVLRKYLADHHYAHDMDNNNSSAVDRLNAILRKRQIQQMLDAQEAAAASAETDDESTTSDEYIDDGEEGKDDDRETRRRRRNAYQKEAMLKKNYNDNHNSHDHKITLTSHESHIAEDIIDPDDIDITFDDIGGIDSIKQEMWELAILPLIRPDLFDQSKLISSQPTSGILLYGRPGTGKTMLAKAIAREAKAIFIPIQLSKILNKWVGESNKLVSATFSLARKLAPAIIFIDEIDTFLYKGSSMNGGGSGGNIDQLKSEFLTLWDGISVNNNKNNKYHDATNTNKNNKKILVLGATNKPNNIDAAIKRRMPRAFQVPLPSEHGRYQILNILCKDQLMDYETRHEYLKIIAKDDHTKYYSGSDLKELCRTAFMEPIREITSDIAKRAVGTYDNSNEKRSSTERKRSKRKVRPVQNKDFNTALEKVKASYNEEEEVFSVPIDPKIIDKIRKRMEAHEKLVAPEVPDVPSL